MKNTGISIHRIRFEKPIFYSTVKLVLEDMLVFPYRPIFLSVRDPILDNRR